MTGSVMEVAVGVILDPVGKQVLVAKRPPGVHLGDCWEFPGGKLEVGEAVEDALKRELLEEIGITVQSSEPLIRLENRYADRVVRLFVRIVNAYSGVPHGREGQTIRWVAASDLSSIPFPPANQPIVQALHLPDLLGILNVFDHDPSAIEGVLYGMAEQGVRMVRLREGPVPIEDKVISAWIEVTKGLGLQLLITGSPNRVRCTGASGLHLRTTELMGLSGRELPRAFWLSASCHTLGELKKAVEIGVDFAVLGPVLPTKSHPEAEGMGWGAFQNLVHSVNLPVYALGGLGRKHLQQAKASGARGVAGVGAFAVAVLS